MLRCSLLIALMLALVPGTLAAEKTKTITPVGTYEVAAKDKSFIADFLAVMKKHPDAAKQFSLVDMGVTQTVAGVIVWECEDFGEQLDPPDCRPEKLE